MTPSELKALRHTLGKTQPQMADTLGLSVGGYRKWEHGDRSISGPALKLIEQLRTKERSNELE